MDAYTKTENTEERAAIVQKRLGETYLITEVYSFSFTVDFFTQRLKQHSQLWRDWGRKQIENRRKEAANRQEEKLKKERATEQARVQAFVIFCSTALLGSE
jgi:hypothetical protein